MTDLQDPAERLGALDEAHALRGIAGEGLLDEQVEAGLGEGERRLDVGRGRHRHDRRVDVAKPPQVVEGGDVMLAGELVGARGVAIDDRGEHAVAVPSRAPRHGPGMQPPHRPGPDHRDTQARHDPTRSGANATQAIPA